MHEETFPDLEQLRLDNGHAIRSENSFYKKRVRGEFLKGPIPLSWLTLAAEMPATTLAVAIALMFEVGRRRSQQIILTTAILTRFGVNRKAKYRALDRLEKSKLISVIRRPRKNPLVTVLPVGLGHREGSSVENNLNKMENNV